MGSDAVFYGFLTDFCFHFKQGSFIFISLTNLELPKIRDTVITTFDSLHHPDLLIVDCGAQSVEEYLETLWNPLCEIIAKNLRKRMIVITQGGQGWTYFKLSREIHCEKRDDYGFHNLTENSPQKLLEKPVKFQGRKDKLSFGQLLGILDSGNISTNELKELTEIIDWEVLVGIIPRDEIQIGGDLGTIGEIGDHYIHRRIYRHVVIEENILNSQSIIPDLLAISGIEREFTGNLSPMREMISLRARSPSNVHFLSSTQEEKQFKALCAKNIGRNIHWLKRESGRYLWQRSRGAITYLNRYRDITGNIDDNYRANAPDLSEDDLVSHDEPVIISHTAGAGKSTMLMYLAGKMKRNQPDMLVLGINLNHNATALLEMKEKSSYNLRVTNGAVKFLVDKLLSYETSFTRKVYEILIMKKRKVTLMFDGFDDISPRYEDTVIELLQTLAEHGIRNLFVATRPHTKEALERKLHTFSYEIKPFSLDHQKDFLTRFWKTNLSSHCNCKPNLKTEGRIKKYAEAIMKKIAESIEDEKNKLTGIPIQTKLVAEIFENHSGGKLENFDSCKEFVNSIVDQPKFPERIDLIYLYEHFVEKKFNIFFDKRGGNLADVAVMEDKKLRYDVFRRTHERLALYALFDENKIKDLLPDLPSQRDASGIPVERDGIITQFIDGRPLFAHRTYAEYFAANFLSDILKRDNQNESLRKFVIADVLLGEDHQTMRVFMNLLLSDKHINEHQSESWNLHLNEHRNAWNETVLHIAAREGNSRIIKLFLNCLSTNPMGRKALINVKNIFDRTAVGQAARYGYIDIIESLMEDPDFEINSHDRNVVALRDPDIVSKILVVEYLLDKEANVNPQTRKSETPLHAAGFRGELDVAECFLKQRVNINFGMNEGVMVLNVAAFRGQLNVVEYLLEKGVDVNSETNDGMMPLHAAVQAGELAMVKYLLEKGVNVNCQTTNGRTPLHTAAAAGNLDVARYLLQKGADIHSQTKTGAMPLHAAASAGELQLVECFLNRGANINCQTKEGETPLHAAASSGKLDVMEYLLGEWVNINCQGYEAVLLRHADASSGKLKVVKYLLDKGANINCQTKTGETPLHAAAAAGRLDAVKYLLDMGANINSRTNKGEQPLHAAISANKSDVVTFLLQKGAKGSSSR